MNEDKAARFQRLRRRALVLGAVWTAALLAGLLLTGLSRAMESWAAALTAGLSPPLASVAASALVASIIWGLHEIVALPIACYLGFVLERRYGLSRQRGGQWLRDYARASALSWLVAAASAAVVYEAMRAWPSAWWLGVWALGVAVSVCLAWLAPVLLMPLFFRFRSLADDALKARLLDLSSRAGTPALDVFEWRLGDRTRRASAALTGLGSTRRILVSDTLVADYSADEVEVVLAHELAHHVHGDVWRALVWEGVVLGGSLLAARMVLPAAGPALGLRGAADLAGLPLLLLVGLAVTTAGLPLVNAASRDHERRADGFALELTRKPEAFVSAMKRLAAHNLAEESPSAFARLFFSTHPPFHERLARAREWRKAVDSRQ